MPIPGGPQIFAISIILCPLLPNGSPLVLHEHSPILQESLDLRAPHETLNVLAIVSCI